MIALDVNLELRQSPRSTHQELQWPGWEVLFSPLAAESKDLPLPPLRLHQLSSLLAISRCCQSVAKSARWICGVTRYFEHLQGAEPRGASQWH